MKKILIIDPYLDTLGGGEEHILSIGRFFQDNGFSVVLAWPDELIQERIKSRLNIDLKHVVFKKDFLDLSPLSRFIYTSQFDYLIYATDGSYFLSGAKNNYIFSMYPKKELYIMNLINKIKLSNFTIIANSQFTKRYLDPCIDKSIKVLTPYLNDGFFGPITKTKKKQIVSVGRFFGHLHSKRQDILIEAFKKFQLNNRDWNLILIGGLRDEDKEFFKKIQSLAYGNKHISLMPNMKFETMVQTLDESMIYWHGAGYGLDEKRDVEGVEHFGITPLEAMARGCIVYAYDAGGQKDIITSGINGYLYNTVDQLVKKTELIVNDSNQRNSMQKKGLEKVKEFTYQAFKVQCQKIFGI